MVASFIGLTVGWLPVRLFVVPTLICTVLLGLCTCANPALSSPCTGQNTVSVICAGVTTDDTAERTTTSAAPTTVTIAGNNGGYGVAAVISGSTPADLTVTNSGSVAIGPGASTLTGLSALQLTGNGGLIGYSGNGSLSNTSSAIVEGDTPGLAITNTANGGGGINANTGTGSVTGLDAIVLTTSGSGAINLTTSGAITSSPSGGGITTTTVDGLNSVNVVGGVITAPGYGIVATSEGTGNVRIDMTGGQLISTGFGGIAATADGPSGNVFVKTSAITAPLLDVFATSNGGSVRVDVDDPIIAGSMGQALQDAVLASGAIVSIVNIANNITANADGGVFAGGGARTIVNQTAGTISSSGNGIETAGASIIHTAGGEIVSGANGIDAEVLVPTGGITILGGNLVISAGDGIHARIGYAGNPDDINVTVNSAMSINAGTIGSAAGVFTQTVGSGNIAITVDGNVNASGNGIDAEITNIGEAGIISGTGSTTINNSGDISGQIGAGVTVSGGAANVLNNTGSITGNIGVQLSGGTTILENSGTIRGAGGAALQIDEGVLQLGQGNGQIVGNVVDNGILAFNRPDTLTFGTTISGTGALQQLGPGTTVLTAVNTFTGGTTLSGGVVAAGNKSALGTGTVTFNGGTLQAAAAAISLGNPAQIGASGGTIDANGNTITLSGGIFNASGYNGPAGLTIVSGSGTGMVVLSGTDSYIGPTTIASGTLEVANGPGAGTFVSNVAIATNAAFVIDRSDTSTYFGSLSGAGAFSTVGPGLVVLDGNSGSFAGITTVSSGTIEVGDAATPGALLGGNVTVDAGATLAGHGTIGGNVTNLAGNVAPGGSIDTLTVGGSYTQGSSGTLTVEVSPGAASKLAVGGAANLAGKLALAFDPGVYTPTSYTLLSASSLSGTFSSVTGTNPSGLPQTILYESDGVDPSVVLALNQATVTPTNDTIYSAVTSIAVLNAQQLNGVILDRIGARQAGIADGEVTALSPGLAGAQLARAGAGNSAVLGDIAAALPRALSAEGAWFRGIGSFAAVDGNVGAPGFSGSTGGFLAGWDRPVAPNRYLGLAAGYLHSDIDEHAASSGTAQSARLAVYGGALVDRSLFTATAGYAHDWFATSRSFAGIGTASESHSGDEATAAGQWSLPLPIQGLGGTATLTPKAGIEYLHLFEAAFTETGAGGLDLAASNRGTDSLQPYIAAALSQKFITAGGTRIAPELRLGYAYEIFDSRLLTVTSLSGDAFPVEGVKPTRGQLTAGIGIVIQAAHLAAYADYDAIVPTGNTTEQVVQAGLRWRF
jgi:fibronectin-binding autotransporter adhesin